MPFDIEQEEWIDEAKKKFADLHLEQFEDIDYDIENPDEDCGNKIGTP